MDNKNYSIIPKNQVPTRATILPEVWQMNRKRDTKTIFIKKWKAHPNIDVSRTKKGVHYEQPYTPVSS